MSRRNLQALATFVVVLTCAANLWRYNHDLSGLQLRSEDEVATTDYRWRVIRNELMKARYPNGEIGYMAAGVLRGHVRTPTEGTQWAQARYAMIPWKLILDSLDAPYVIADLSGNLRRDVPLPEGFDEVFRSDDGLILLKKKTQSQ